MVKHLRSLTEQSLIMSFTPKSPLLVLLKGIGWLFRSKSSQSLRL